MTVWAKNSRIDSEVEQLVVRMATQNSDWGYDRIVGALANLGYTLSDQTVGDILQPQVSEFKIGEIGCRCHINRIPVA